MTGLGILCRVLLWQTVIGELFSSFKQLENLLDIEIILRDRLVEFIENQKEMLRKLESISQQMTANVEGSRDRERYVGNPINQFFIVKSLSRERMKVKRLLDESARQAEFVTELESQYKFPDEDDYVGVLDGIYRLQDTYKLSPGKLGQGNMSVNYKSSPLKAFEYFEIGLNAFNKQDYYHALPWFLEAQKQSGEDDSLDQHKLRDYMAFTTFKQGNIGHALNLTRQLLIQEPDDGRLQANLKHFSDMRQNLLSNDLINSDDEQSLHQIVNERGPDTFPEKQKYEALCSGDGLMNDLERLSKLVCRLSHNNKPRLMLKPVKEEELFDDPKIVMFHDVLNDEEIAMLKKLAEPHLERALIHNPQTSALEPAQYRISKLCWLSEVHHPVVARLSELMEDMMNLTMKTAEMLQIQNYGVGGHYEPHFDFARGSEASIFSDGNRIATWLTYLTDVEYGGSTVFTPINIRVLPRKGSAVVWYNLFKSGLGDYRTRHAACPVLFGTKWVANRWVHQNGQEFIRPCDVDPMM